MYFLRPVSTGLPWDQSRAVDLPYHKTSVVWSESVGAVLEIFHRAPPLADVLRLFRPPRPRSFLRVGRINRERGTSPTVRNRPAVLQPVLEKYESSSENVFNPAAALFYQVCYFGGR